jgi:hypothetical protein
MINKSMAEYDDELNNTESNCAVTYHFYLYTDIYKESYD